MLYKFSKIYLLLTILSNDCFSSSLINKNQESYSINKVNSLIKRFDDPIPYSSFPEQINYYSFDVGNPVSRFECFIEGTNGIIVERLSSGGARLSGALYKIGNFMPTEDMSDQEIIDKLAEYGSVKYTNLFNPLKVIDK